MKVKRRYRDCQCERCVACCNHFPGYFLPGEAEHAAKTLGLTWKWFRYRYLTRREHGVLSPAVVGPAREGVWGMMLHGTGRCTFLTADNRCRIHEVKPFECRASYGCRQVHEHKLMRAFVFKRWRQRRKELA